MVAGEVFQYFIPDPTASRSERCSGTFRLRWAHRDRGGSPTVRTSARLFQRYLRTGPEVSSCARGHLLFADYAVGHAWARRRSDITAATGSAIRVSTSGSGDAPWLWYGDPWLFESAKAMADWCLRAWMDRRDGSMCDLGMKSHGRHAYGEDAPRPFRHHRRPRPCRQRRTSRQNGRRTNRRLVGDGPTNRDSRVPLRPSSPAHLAGPLAAGTPRTPRPSGRPAQGRTDLSRQETSGSIPLVPIPRYGSAERIGRAGEQQLRHHRHAASASSSMAAPAKRVFLARSSRRMCSTATPRRHRSKHRRNSVVPCPWNRCPVSCHRPRDRLPIMMSSKPAYRTSFMGGAHGTVGVRFGLKYKATRRSRSGSHFPAGNPQHNH